MWRALTLFVVAIFDALLPRHPRAERARALSEREIADLVVHTTLPKHSWIHALLPYRDERVRALIQAVKYYGEQDVAEIVAPYGAECLMELVSEKRSFEGWGRAVIAPIPTSGRRLRERGYNQAAVFARAIHASFPEAQYDESLLTREERPSQVHLPRAARSVNMRGAFHASARASGRFVILVDDVVESGSTLCAAREALLDAGAKDVIAIAIAH
jgi:predicted amidophosphoribosyltransferase